MTTTPPPGHAHGLQRGPAHDPVPAPSALRRLVIGSPVAAFLLIALPVSLAVMSVPAAMTNMPTVMSRRRSFGFSCTACVASASMAMRPPSPLLSARRMSSTYLTEMITVMVQNTSESTPRMFCGVTGTWGANEIIGILGADKATLIGVIEWFDGDIGTFTAVRPGR